jgi:hypothetical protein
MLSEQFPEQKKLLCQSLTKGACDSMYSKLNIFSPSEIDTVNYTPGRHKAAPTGRVVLPARDELLLLHYHYLDFERVRKRYAQFLTRQRKTDIAKGFGEQYSWSSEQFRDAWNLVANRLVDISRPNLRPWDTHEGPRWWRERGKLRKALIMAKRWRTRVRARVQKFIEPPQVLRTAQQRVPAHAPVR